MYKLNKRLLIHLILTLIIINITYADSAIDAYNLYNDARTTIENIQSKGYPTLPLYNLLEQSENSYNSGNYNKSIEYSNEIIIQSQIIIDLKEEFEKISLQINTLQKFKIDTTQAEALLLYARSDYEAANIDLAIQEKEEILKNINTVSKNLTDELFKEIKTYKNTSENKSSETFNKYYEFMNKLYYSRDYQNFLIAYSDFNLIVNIEQNIELLDNNLLKIKQNNISFNIINDQIKGYDYYISQNDYQNALKIIKETNNLAKTAIELKTEINKTAIEIERINGLGILDNKTIELYNSAIDEYALENYLVSKQKIQQTKEALIEIEKQNIILGGINRAALKKNAIDFFIRNWIVLLILSLIIMLGYKPSKMYYTLKRSEFLVKKSNQESDAISNLQKDLQKTYFMDKILDKKTYDSEYKNYEEKSVDVENRLIILNEKIKTSKQNLDNITSKIRSFLKFNKKNIGDINENKRN